MHNRLAKIRQLGFSLLELSIVITILSIMAVMGLEMAAAFLSSSAYQNSQTTISNLDTALVKYRAVYGRLPCPARLDLPTGDANYGSEDCAIANVAQVTGGIAYVKVINGGSGYTEDAAAPGTFAITFSDATNIYATSATGTAHLDENGAVQYITIENPGYGFSATDTVNGSVPGGNPGTGLNASITVSNISIGMVPVRELNLPLATALDGFNGKILYYVTTNLTTTGTFGNSAGVIQMRNGPLTEPCAGNCTIQPTNSTISGYAYALISTGKDQRGAYNPIGVKKNDCFTTGYGTAIDTQNCIFENAGANVTPTHARGVIYNSPFNNGNVGPNYTDDIVVARMKSEL